MTIFDTPIIIALVKLFDMFNKKDWKGVGKVVVAVLVGLGGSFLAHDLVYSTNVLVEGLTYGLQAAGLMTAASAIGGKKNK
nr:MAG TPA: hypothetical protein [Caudoviricetes sp.]